MCPSGIGSTYQKKKWPSNLFAWPTDKKLLLGFSI